MSDPFSERCCGTCRHWRRDEACQYKHGRRVEPDGHHCTLLVVVTAHTWGKPHEKGDIVTRQEAWGQDLAVEALQTVWSHGCRAWNREEPIPARWSPIERHPHEATCRCPWCLDRLKGAA